MLIVPSIHRVSLTPIFTNIARRGIHTRMRQTCIMCIGMSDGAGFRYYGLVGTSTTPMMEHRSEVGDRPHFGRLQVLLLDLQYRTCWAPLSSVGKVPIVEVAVTQVLIGSTARA
jgi:hypothetical protein